LCPHTETAVNYWKTTYASDDLDLELELD